MLKRTLLSLPVAACIAITSFGAMAASDKPLVVGTEGTFAPFEFQGPDAKELVGFDIDLIKALAEQMGRKADIQNLGFDALIPAIRSGNIDVAIAGMSITEPRKKVVDFSNPYYTSGLIILVNSDDNATKGIKDLEGKRIACQLATTGESKSRSVKEAKVTSFNNANEAFMELANHGVDAVIQDAPVVAYYLASGQGSGKMVGERMEAEDYGIAVKKGNAQLVKDLNDALDAIKKNGVYDKIYAKWFGK